MCSEPDLVPDLVELLPEERLLAQLSEALAVLERVPLAARLRRHGMRLVVVGRLGRRRRGGGGEEGVAAAAADGYTLDCQKKDTHQKKALLCTYALPSALTKGFPAAAAALDWSGAASGLEKGLEEEEELEAGVAAATSLAGDLGSIAAGGMMEEEEVEA